MILNGFVENLEKNIKIIENQEFNLNLETIKKGNAKGVLWGGNLSSIASLLTSEFYLKDEDIILLKKFLEDLNEPLYKIDKMMYEIYRCEKIKGRIRGIIFGDFYLKFDEIKNLFFEYSELFNVPSRYCPDITHKINNVTLPYGVWVEI